MRSEILYEQAKRSDKNASFKTASKNLNLYVIATFKTKK